MPHMTKPSRPSESNDWAFSEKLQKNYKEEISSEEVSLLLGLWVALGGDEPCMTSCFLLYEENPCFVVNNFCVRILCKEISNCKL